MDQYAHFPCVFLNLGFNVRTYKLLGGEDVICNPNVKTFTFYECEELVLLTKILLDNPLDVKRNCLHCREYIILVQQLSIQLMDYNSVLYCELSHTSKSTEVLSIDEKNNNYCNQVMRRKQKNKLANW